MNLLKNIWLEYEISFEHKEVGKVTNKVITEKFRQLLYNNNYVHCLFEIFSKDLQNPSFTIKNSSEALRFRWERGWGRELTLDETSLKFTTLFQSGRNQNVYPVLEPRMLIIHPVMELPLLLKQKLCIVLYWRQRPYLCVTYLTK